MRPSHTFIFDFKFQPHNMTLTGPTKYPAALSRKQSTHKPHAVALLRKVFRVDVDMLLSTTNFVDNIRGRRKNTM